MFKRFLALSFLLLGLNLSSATAFAAPLGGTWAGSGFIAPVGAERQRVRCVVRYDRRSSRVFGVRATCASSSGSIRQTGELLQIRRNLYAGDFYNQQFDIGGRIRVIVRGGRQTVTFSSSDGAGQLTLRRR